MQVAARGWAERVYSPKKMPKMPAPGPLKSLRNFSWVHEVFVTGPAKPRGGGSGPLKTHQRAS